MSLFLTGAAGCELIAGLQDHELASSTSGGDAATDSPIGEGGGPTSGFTVTAPASLIVGAGASASAMVTIARAAGFSQVINVTASGLPSSATSNPVVIASDATSGSLTIAIAASAAQSLTHLTIAGVSADGKTSASAPLDLIVRGPSGSLDDLFATHGIATGFTTSTEVGPSAIALDPSGRIVILSSAGYMQGLQFQMLRLTPDGAPDNTFNTTGVITHTFDTTPDIFPGLFPLAGEAWLVAGYTGPNIGPNTTAFAHVTAAGAFDSTYSPDGGAGASYTAVSQQVISFAVDSTGRILAVGTTTDPQSKIHLERRLASGALDPGFTAVNQQFGTGNAYASALTVQPDGNILVFFTGNDTAGAGIAFARYLPTGALDTTFGVGGYVAPNSVSATPDGVTTFLLQPDGKILAVGRNDLSSSLVRFKANGSLDTFGPTGEGSLSVPGGVGGIALQADGKILVNYVDDVTLDAGVVSEVALARFTSGGVVDTTFGNAGTVTTQVVSGDAFGGPMLVQPDGRIVIAASAFTSGDTTDYEVMRFWP